MSNTPQQDIDDLIAALQGEYQITFVLADPESPKKLDSLKDGGRDFFAITPQLEQAATVAMNSNDLGSFQPGKATQYIRYILGKGGEAVLKHVLGRFKGSRDVRMNPLSREWVKEKGHNRIGIYTTDLLKDLTNAKVQVTKK